MHELTVSNVFNEPPTDESIPVNPLLSVSQIVSYILKIFQNEDKIASRTG